MRRSNTDAHPLLARDFLLACAANFLLYASVYAVLPMLAVCARGTYVYPAFLTGMWLVGPFHAWLADRFRRKHVWVYPFIGSALAVVGCIYATSATELALLALWQGGCFGLASAAGTTVSIDIVPSGHRTSANMTFATVGRLGIAVGWLLLVVWLKVFPEGGFRTLFTAAAVASGVGILLASPVYVSFRAPIGLRVCSFDRFLLGRAWLPALNVGLIGAALALASFCLFSLPGLSMDLLGWVPMLLLAAWVPGLVKMFVKLSHHCQRATGNVTFHLWMAVGVLFGIQVGALPWGSSCEGWMPLVCLAVAVAMYAGIPRVYYKKMRVR